MAVGWPSGPTSPTVVAFDVTPRRVLARIAIPRRGAPRGPRGAARLGPPEAPGECCPGDRPTHRRTLLQPIRGTYLATLGLNAPHLDTPATGGYRGSTRPDEGTAWSRRRRPPPPNPLRPAPARGVTMRPSPPERQGGTGLIVADRRRARRHRRDARHDPRPAGWPASGERQSRRSDRGQRDDTASGLTACCGVNRPDRTQRNAPALRCHPRGSTSRPRRRPLAARDGVAGDRRRGRIGHGRRDGRRDPRRSARSGRATPSIRCAHADRVGG